LNWLHRGRPSRPVAIGLAVLLVLLASGIGVSAHEVPGHLVALERESIAELTGGMNELRAGQSDLGGEIPTDLTRLDVAQAHFQSAALQFQRASDMVASDRILDLASSLPLPGPVAVGPRVRAFDAVARMGIALARAGQDAVTVGRQFLSQPPSAESGGQRLLLFLSASAAPLDDMRSRLGQARALAGQVDRGALSASQRQLLDDATKQIDGALQTVDGTRSLLVSLEEILGAKGPRRYLVEEVDPSELRAGGGYIGAYSLLTVDRGTVTLTASGDTNLLDQPYPQPGQPGYLAPPAVLQAAFGHSWALGDSGYYPEFTESAPIAEDLFHRRSGTAVDGVISLDAWAVADLLQVTGPITVPGYDITVRADTFPDDYFQREEVANPDLPGNRKDLLSATAVPLIASVTQLPGPSWQALLDALGTAAAERHLQLYFNDAGAEATVTRAGWSGPALPVQGADETMMEVEEDVAGDKANHWLKRSFDLALTSAGGSLRHVLTVDWQNLAPPGYAGGREYHAYVRLYVPAQSTALLVAGLNSHPLPVDEQPAGMKLLDGFLDMGPLSSASARFEWTTPAGSGGASRRLVWVKQPGTLADPVQVTLAVPAGTYSAGGSLQRDRQLVLSSNALSG
jgi:hypothetical protein